MAISLENVCQELDVFLAVTKSEHFILYIPYHGQRMLDFLSSCFHRGFMQRVHSHGFRETAIFTEPDWLGRIFLLLSRSPTPGSFGMENSKALQAGGVFSKAFAIEQRGILPCLAVESNTLLIQHDDFYRPHNEAPRRYVDRTGAQTLAAYAALRDGLYDISEHLFQPGPASYSCKSIHCTCYDPPPLYLIQYPDDNSFTAPWDRPYIGISKLSPYLVLNILASELGNSATQPLKREDMSHIDTTITPKFLRPPPPTSAKMGPAMGTPTPSTGSQINTDSFHYPPSTVEARSWQKESQGSLETQLLPVQTPVAIGIHPSIGVTTQPVRPLGSLPWEADIKSENHQVEEMETPFRTHESLLGIDLLQKLMGREYSSAGEVEGGKDPVAYDSALATSSDSEDEAAERPEARLPEKAAGTAAAVDYPIHQGDGNVSGAKAKRRRRENQRRKEKKQQRAGAGQAAEAAVDE